MPLVLAPLVILAALVLSVLALMVSIWLRSALDHFPSFPVVGNIVGRFAGNITNAVIHSIERWVTAPLGQVSTFLHTFGTIALVGMDAVRDTFLQVERALLLLRKTVVPALIHLAVAPLHIAIHNLETLLHDFKVATAKALDSLDGRLGHLTTELRKTVEVPLTHLLDVTVPELRKSIAHTAAVVGDVVLPRLGRVEHEADALGAELGRMLGDLTPAEVAKLLAEAGGIYALVRLIEAEAGLGNKGCRDKVKLACTTDPLEWAGLMALLAGGLAWGGLDELIRAEQAATRELLPGLLDLARS